MKRLLNLPMRGVCHNGTSWLGCEYDGYCFFVSNYSVWGCVMKLWYKRFHALNILKFGDILSTHYALLLLGRVEQNPFPKFLYDNIGVALGTIVIFVIAVLLHWIILRPSKKSKTEKRSKFRTVAFFFMLFSYVAVIIWNLRIIIIN